MKLNRLKVAPMEVQAGTCKNEVALWKVTNAFIKREMRQFLISFMCPLKSRSPQEGTIPVNSLIEL